MTSSGTTCLSAQPPSSAAPAGPAVMLPPETHNTLTSLRNHHVNRILLNLCLRRDSFLVVAAPLQAIIYFTQMTSHGWQSSGVDHRAALILALQGMKVNEEEACL